LSDTMIRPTDERAVAAMFDRISKRYDFLNRLLSLRQDVRWRNHLVACTPQKINGVFVDVATGTGDVALTVGQIRPEYTRIVGVDISEGMLSFARTKTPSEDTRFEWLTMSAESLQLPNQSADALSISFGLRNVVDKSKALSEFSRVLKPQGHLMILEFFTPTTGIFAALFQWYFHRVLPVIGKLLSEKEAYEYLPKSVASFYSPKELREELKKRGFSIITEKNFLFGACRLVHSKKGVA
jgi:demethylmenaquinone methyltransferase/2-methoxy-6-polyprenyl-1,4-benzoquinol methylase